MDLRAETTPCLKESLFPPGCTSDPPRPRRRPTQAPGHGQRRARCIHALQASDVESLARGAACGAPRLDPLWVAFRRVERFFFIGSLRRCNARQIVAELTRGPCAAAIRSRNASRGAAGCVSTSRRRRAGWSLRARRLPPAWGCAARRPLRRKRCHRFSTTESLTQKRSAIVPGGSSPLSSTRIIRSRRSEAYGFIPLIMSSMGQTYNCKPL